MVLRQEGEVRPIPRLRRHRARLDPVRSGRFRSRFRAVLGAQGVVQDRRQSRLRPELLHERQVRLLRLGLWLRSARRHRSVRRHRLHGGQGLRLLAALPVAAALACRGRERQLLRFGAWVATTSCGSASAIAPTRSTPVPATRATARWPRRTRTPAWTTPWLLYRDRVAFFKGTNLDVYAGDTFTKGRMALNLGLRFDQQKASNEASTAPAQRLIPDLFPEVTIDPESASRHHLEQHLAARRGHPCPRRKAQDRGPSLLRTVRGAARTPSRQPATTRRVCTIRTSPTAGWTGTATTWPRATRSWSMEASSTRMASIRTTRAARHPSTRSLPTTRPTRTMRSSWGSSASWPPTSR